MTEPAGIETPLGVAPTREELEGLTREQIHETHDVPLASKADMIAVVLDKFGVPTPRSGEVILAVDGLSSDEHRYSHDDEDAVITRAGTAVPASKADQIIREAAAVGVRIREVN